MPSRKSHEQFIQQSNKKHNSKYNYPDLYIKDNVKINIECPIHGLFAQIPSSHLQGCGCPECAINFRSTLLTKKHIQFIEKAHKIHNNKYNYPNTYVNAFTKINIECPIHGVFKQTPDKHLHKNGCPECGGTVRKTKDAFVMEANLIHNNKYRYPGDYINARTDIAIECMKHGIFWQVPDIHLNGCGCPTCACNGLSKLEMKWLDSLGIPNDNVHRQCRLYIGNFYIKPDGFDPKTNTIYEFYGDYFHGNPKIYDADVINSKNNRKCGDLYKDTMIREKMIKEAGYNLVFIWESDWKNNYKV